MFQTDRDRALFHHAPAETWQKTGCQGDAQTLKVPRRLRQETTMTLQRLANRLHMGVAGSLANLLRGRKASNNVRLSGDPFTGCIISRTRPGRICAGVWAGESRPVPPADAPWRSRDWNRNGGSSRNGFENWAKKSEELCRIPETPIDYLLKPSIQTANRTNQYEIHLPGIHRT